MSPTPECSHGIEDWWNGRHLYHSSADLQAKRKVLHPEGRSSELSPERAGPPPADPSPSSSDHAPADWKSAPFSRRRRRDRSEAVEAGGRVRLAHVHEFPGFVRAGGGADFFPGGQVR